MNRSKCAGCAKALIDGPQPVVIKGRPVADVDGAAVEAFRDRLASHVSPATVNRHLVLLKATFNRGIRAGKGDANPVRGLKLLENNVRERFLAPDEETRLLAALPEYLRRSWWLPSTRVSAGGS
jgi:hypothetical protein